MVQENCIGTCFLQGFWQDMADAASRAQGLHALCRDFDMLCLFLDHTDIRERTGEEDRHTGIIHDLITSKRKIKCLFAIVIGFGVNR